MVCMQTFLNVISAILVASCFGGALWNNWVYWFRMYPYMEERGVLPRKWLWPPVWVYKTTCLAENRSLKYWDYFWFSGWMSVLSWVGLVILMVVSEQYRDQRVS